MTSRWSHLVLALAAVIPMHISVGLEYRRLKLDANIGALVPGDLDMGGDFFFATARGHF